MRCELNDVLSDCPREAVLTVAAVEGIEPLEAANFWTAHACAEHAWEATARAAIAVRDARVAGSEDARVVAIVEPAGEQLLELLQMGVTIGDRWPLAKPWSPPVRP
jgi:hypothetical protein